MSKCQIALVVPGLTNGGGVPTVARFLYSVIAESGRYQPELISLATSMLDQSSVRLLSPISYFRGPQIVSGIWEEKPFLHVGAVLAELEFQRYRPRKVLTNLLNRYDLIQVVAGTPGIAMAVTKVERPLCIFVATTSYMERSTLLSQERGLGKAWLSGMTSINTAIERRALPKMSHVFAESKYTHRLLREIVPNERLSIGVPGVDTHLFSPGIYREQSYILSVGRFGDPRKNVKMLFEAYYHLRQAAPNSPRLMLVGSTGPSQEALDLSVSLGISDYVDIKLDATAEELAEFYRNASLFVLSSDEEGLGVVILEAMASGIPVVSTRSGGPETLIVDGETGCLTPVGEARAMTKKLQELLADKSVRGRMGAASRRLVEERFSLEAAGKAYLRKYDELITGSKHTRRS
jgi:D-inositol-3-phosphate glycosyltransferase